MLKNLALKRKEVFMITENVSFEIEGSVGWITINRPKALNALNKQTLIDLLQVTKFAQTQIHQGVIRLVVLTGKLGENPKTHAFIAGADIKELSSLNAQQAQEISQIGQKVTIELESLSAPVIAAVGGFALGGGLEMALSCDFIWCTKNAQFGLPEVKLGLIPGFGGTTRLVKAIGRYHAREMIFTGKMVSAEKAIELHLCNALFEDMNHLKAKIQEFAQELKLCSASAINLAKNVMNQSADLSIIQGLQIELQAFARTFTFSDSRSGTQAFMEKRMPDFNKEIL